MFKKIKLLNFPGAPADLDTILDNVGATIKYQLPPLAVPYIPRPEEESAIKNFHSNSQKFVVLTGVRGVGKSELARKIAEDHTGSVLWINSTRITEMVKDFRALYNTNVGTEENKKVTEVIRGVFEHFKAKNTLYVFDEAYSDNVLLKQLNRYIREDDNSRAIVTSRSPNWENFFSIIPVDVFTKNEAITFTKLVLKDLQIPLDDLKCEELARELSYLPLALKKSTDYIIKQNSHQPYTIDDFIYELKNGKLPVTPPPEIYVPEPVPQDFLNEAKEEIEKFGQNVGKGAEEAWEKVSSGVQDVGSSISHGAQHVGHQISQAANHVGSQIKNVFSGFG